MAVYNFIAFDLGATSGRTILARFDSETKNLSTRELTRFPNGILNYGSKSYWNLLGLYAHLKEGLRVAAGEKVEITSAGIDTWGVDFVCFDADGQPVGNPRAYRDAQLSGAPERFFEEKMSADKLYGITGIQHLSFNTVFQFNEYAATFPVKNAAKILFLPDALSFMLTGEAVTEYTIASTGAVLDAEKRTLSPEILAAAGMVAEKFAPVIEPPVVLGNLLPETAAETGIGEIKIVAVAGHDTAAAVAAVPALDKNFAYLSSGTWSLMGIETSRPVINDTTRHYNITNEGGVDGTIRLLKNITGMWVIEQCLQAWKREGVSYSYPEMVELAAGAPAFRAFIDPDDTLFTAPANMPAAINRYLEQTGQPLPENHAQVLRMVFESLALKYRHILGIFRSLSENPVDRLHVIGGGSRNTLLNQFTADSIGLPVVAGPAEASAMGNILLQAQAAGAVKNLHEIREVVAHNTDLMVFEPENTEKWTEAYERFKHLM